MRKILALILCATLLLCCSVAFAASWGKSVTTKNSPYTLTITKYSASSDALGNRIFKAYTGSSDSGDLLYCSIKLTVPSAEEIKSNYGCDPAGNDAKFTITLSGINSLSCPADDTVPAADDVAKTYYYSPAGWVNQNTVISGRMEDVTAASLTAKISMTETANGIIVAKKYATEVNGNEVVFSNADTAMVFKVTETGKITATHLGVENKLHKIYATRLGYAVEGDNETGAWHLIAEEYFDALGMTYEDIYAGGVFMTEDNIISNFGANVKTITTAAWHSTSPVTTPIGAIPIPKTGAAISLLGALVALSAGAVLAKRKP